MKYFLLTITCLLIALQGYMYATLGNELEAWIPILCGIITGFAIAVTIAEWAFHKK